MSCDFTEKVSLLIDGELPPNEARAVERHLLECVECRQMRADFLSLRNQISAYLPALATTAPRGALAQVLSPPAVATAAPTRRERFPWAFGARRLTPVLTTVVATVLIGCAIALALLVRSRRGGFNSAPRPAVVQKQRVINSAGNPSATPSPEAAAGSVELLNRRKPGDEFAGNSEQKRPDIRSRESEAAAKYAARVKARSKPTLRSENTATPNDVALDASRTDTTGTADIRSADTETLTAQHVEQSGLLLRAFRNLRPATQAKGNDLDYERRRAQQLFYQNVLLRREADAAGDVEVATLLESLEPILLDIANLPARAPDEDVRAINERVERKNLVALLQVNSTSLARANE